MTYALYALCGLSLLQFIAIGVLMRRRQDLDLGRIETRMSHFAEALALLTDTTQSGFSSVAAELERLSGVRIPAVSRAATSKRIVSAARRGRSIQDIAADEEISESEIRLTLGMADDVTATPKAAAKSPTVTRTAGRSRKPAKVAATPAAPAAKAASGPAVVHEQAPRPRARQVSGPVATPLNLGA